MPIPEKGFVAVFHRCAATLSNHHNSQLLMKGEKKGVQLVDRIIE